MFEEYEFVNKQFIINEKADKFLTKDYYKILHLLSGEIIYKTLGGKPNSFILESISVYKARIKGEPRAWYSPIKSCSCPLILPLANCKGFIHTNIKELAQRYPECVFNEFDYIPVSKEEAIAAYGLNIPSGYIAGEK